jgi:hypothetical protein
MRATEARWILKADHVRAIDRFIDYFGESRTAALAILAGAAGVSPRPVAWALAAVPRRPGVRPRR